MERRPFVESAPLWRAQQVGPSDLRRDTFCNKRLPSFQQHAIYAEQHLRKQFFYGARPNQVARVDFQDRFVASETPMELRHFFVSLWLFRSRRVRFNEMISLTWNSIAPPLVEYVNCGVICYFNCSLAALCTRCCCCAFTYFSKHNAAIMVRLCVKCINLISGLKPAGAHCAKCKRKSRLLSACPSLQSK